MASDRLRLGVAVGAAALIVGLTPRGALAYCRTSSCPHVGTSQVCTPAAEGDCGIPLFWPKPCVTYSVQRNASKRVSLQTTRSVLQQAFRTWMTASCAGGGSPRIAVTETEPVDCDKHEYNQKTGNANIVMFRDDSWPYEGSANTLALTTVTYNLDNGQIYDADMELNSADADFTTGNSGVDFDLLSIVTHETGHFLGLAHSPNLDATMYADYQHGDVSLRALSADDVAGICAIYPPGAAIPADCDSTPRHGFSGDCSDGTTGAGGCATAAAGRSASSDPGSAALLALVAAGLVSRRRRVR